MHESNDISIFAGLVQSTAFVSGSKLQGISKSNQDTIQAVKEQVLLVQENSDDTDTDIIKYVMGYMPVPGSTSSGKGETPETSIKFEGC